MIAYLRGLLLEVSSDSMLIETQGIGYEVFSSGLTLQHFQELTGQDIHCWTYTHVREDILQLFGFANRDEKNLFLSLLKVNGVGPKMALSILGGANVDSIHQMIEAGNAKGLSQLPKVGKKTAEQIILTLQGKLVRAEPLAVETNKNHNEIQSALLHLGFKLPMIEEFIETLPPQTDVEEGVRKGLTVLSKAL